LGEGQERFATGGSAFRTTRWSLVVAAGDERDPESREALEALCRSYWPPVYAYVRRWGARSDEARDLTQGFFAKIIERHSIREARPERGKFRTFLLTSLRNYMADERDHAQALKRGGGVAPLSIDAAEAEHDVSLEPFHDDNPERAFDRRWARALLDRCWDRLGQEATDASEAARFARLQALVSGDSPEGYREAAAALEIGESAVRVAVHRMRRRYGAILREEVAHTVQHPEEVEGELRHLLSILRP